MRPLLLALALLAVLVVSAPAGADPPWSAPVQLSFPADSIALAPPAFDARGRLVAAWTFDREAHQGAVVRSRLPGEPWGAPRTIGLQQGYLPVGFRRDVGVGQAADLAAYGNDRLLALGLHYDAQTNLVLQAWDLASGSDATRVQTIVRQPFGGGPVVVSPGGRALVLWTRDYPRPARPGQLVVPKALYGATRAPGQRRFGPARRLSPVPPPPPYGGGRGYALSVRGLQAARSGRVVALAWWRDDRLEARVSQDGGRTFGPVRLVSREKGGGALSVAVAPDGTVAVGWSASPQSVPMESRGPVEYRLATAARDNGFRTVWLLERYELTGAPAFEVEQGPGIVKVGYAGARLLVAWEGLSGTAYVVRTASPSGRDIGPVTTFGPARPRDTGALLQDLATAPDGRAVLAWSSLVAPVDEGPLDVSASLLGAGGAWGAGERVAADVPQPVEEVRLALPPGGGAPTALWTTRAPGGLPRAVFATDRTG